MAAPIDIEHGPNTSYNGTPTGSTTGRAQQQAWAILSNFNSQADWAPDISQAKLISRSGKNLELQQTYRAGYTFGLPIKARLSISEQPPKGFSYRLISGDRLKSRVDG